MVGIVDLPRKYKLYVMGSNRYSIRDTQIHDDVTGQFATIDGIIENVNQR